ncbi:AAA family ATPase [Brevundimonas sp. Root1423]|uniref:AAA family ATPase n=1 Tax=Brevundimonas sp. Root1423 TaxID=1736462 RepID=UPI0006F1C646|nr:AAA family ATPase [Brevundimonas sp. Root1423]KQY75349.1 hypothetical protein ASD25_12500 [Brevundimonas sp. Root1423]
MREAFREWLGQRGFTAKTQSVQWSQGNRLEAAFGDLDAAYDQDALATIRTTLTYTKQDERNGRPNPAPFPIDGDVYANLAGYRATITYYSQFREAEAGGREAPVGTLNLAALQEMKVQFLEKYPDFADLGFQAKHGSYWDDERAYKDVVLGRVEQTLSTTDPDESSGAKVLSLLWQPPSNFVGWRALSHLESLSQMDRQAVTDAIDEMLADAGPAPASAARCASRIHPRFTGGSLRTLVTTAQALARPQDALAVKTQYLQRAAKRLTGRGPFKSNVMTEAEYGELLSLVQSIFTIMRDDWDWSPRDFWDVQSFLWVTSDVASNETDLEEAEAPMTSEQALAVPPTNLILYGPPGTGKTWTTAKRAVELCDGMAPESRSALMARYRELVARKRIGFVTFHQSYAYEDFVEGLRPETGSDADGMEGGTGFSLRPQPGVFRKIAELAQANRGRPIAEPTSYRGRQVFKMSLGRSGQNEGERIFRDAIEGGYVALGWGGSIDWTHERFDDFNAIKARWQEVKPDATGQDPNIQQLYALRSWMKVGDLVVVSDGNKAFRAIGEVTGEYVFAPVERSEYNHRRSVRWLWHGNEPLPRELIYGRGFSQVSIYNLDPEQIAWPALEQIIAGGGEAASIGTAPEPYVLIIDEINRANISKVFGELITLIEPDKRAGCENALSVILPYSGETFSVPANLNIIGTMNTADRSIALLDTALRRRFEFEELLPDPKALAAASARTGVDLVSALEGLNARIEYLFDRDHQIGHAFFMPCKTADDVAQVMRTRVIPLLTEYFYENWEKVRQVLGETEDEGAFITRTRLRPPAGADPYESGEGRWRYAVRTDIAVAAYDQLKP